MQRVALMINVVPASDVQAIRKHHVFSNDFPLQVRPAPLADDTVTEDMTPAGPFPVAENC